MDSQPVRDNFIELSAISHKDYRNTEWCYVDALSIVAVLPSFLSGGGSQILMHGGKEAFVSETPREVMKRMRAIANEM